MSKNSIEFLELTDNLDLWNNSLHLFPDKTPFHTLEWLSIISKSYSFKPEYYIVKDSNTIIGLLPLFYINNLRSKKYVSLPFSMYGGPLLLDQKYMDIIIKFLEAKKTNFYVSSKYSKLLPSGNCFKTLDNYDFYLTPDCYEKFELSLKKNSSIKGSINKCRKNGITFQCQRNPENFTDFYSLFDRDEKTTK